MRKTTGKHHLLAALFALPPLAAPVAAETPKPLPALNIDIAETSISGISSGGYMAAQFQIAHSSIVKGAGIVAAGPYYCAQDSLDTAGRQCACALPMQSCQVSPTSANVPALVQASKQFAQKGLIDDPANIGKQRVATFAGGKDGTVPAPVVKQLGEYYQAMGLSAANLDATVLANAGHTMPTKAYGNACSVTGHPFIGRCGVDAASKILDWVYGGLNPPRTGALRGKFIEFDQHPYAPGGSDISFSWRTSLDDTGWLYVPKACAEGARCRLHVALHGCQQGQDFTPLSGPVGKKYGTTFVKKSGYAQAADTNNIVVLFPQATSNPLFMKNPLGCWDWWGYTDSHYADKKGVQISALRAMVDRLASGAH
jgi:poly(3-hydroxybutyrate) depolymerase